MSISPPTERSIKTIRFTKVVGCPDPTGTTLEQMDEDQGGGKINLDLSRVSDQFCVPSSSSSAGIAPETKSNQDPVVTMKRIHPTVNEDWKYASIVQHVRREEKLIKKEVGWEKRSSEQMWMELKKRMEVIYPEHELILNKNDNQETTWRVQLRRSHTSSSTSVDPQKTEYVVEKKELLARTFNGGVRKCAKNAYHFFINDERPKIIAENPDLHPTLVFKEIGHRWRTIAPEVKQHYEEKAFENLVEFSEYQKERAERIKKKMLRSKNGVDSFADNEGEQISISFGQFAKEKRQEVAAAHPHLSLTQITQKLRDMWKELLGLKPNPEEKALKKQQRMELKRIIKEQRLLMRKKKHVVKKAKLEQLDGEENVNTLKRTYPKKFTLNVTSKGQQRKVPFSAYQLFFFDVQKAIKLENPDWSISQVSKEIRSRWKSLSSIARRPYLAEANKGKKAFYSVNPKSSFQGCPQSLRPYSYFVRNERPLVKAEYPQMNNPQIFKEIAARWRDLSDDEKKEYERKAIEWHEELFEEAKSIVAGIQTSNQGSNHDQSSTLTQTPRHEELFEEAKSIVAGIQTSNQDQSSTLTQTRTSGNWLLTDLDACLSETIDSFNLPKTPLNETEVDAGDNNIHEDVEPETAKSKTAKSKTGKVDVPESKIWTTVYVHDIDGISITEMGYQGDDEENGTDWDSNSRSTDVYTTFQSGQLREVAKTPPAIGHTTDTPGSVQKAVTPPLQQTLMSDANNAASGESPNVDRSAPIPGSLSNLGSNTPEQASATVVREVPAKKPRMSTDTENTSQSLAVESCREIPSNHNNSTTVAAKDWSVDEVADFVGKIPGCLDSAEVLRREEIDGLVFLQLRRKDLLEIGMKAGPAFKISFAIDELASK